jgi:hypothetical protein
MLQNCFLKNKMAISKMQKGLLWLFGAMFLVPEILFLTIPLSILSIINNLSNTGINSPIYYFINSQFFTDHPIYTFIAIIAEWVGVLGLFVLSIKFKKPIFYILLAIVLLWLAFVIFLGYVLTTMSLVM